MSAADIQITEQDGGVELTVKVVPGSSRDRVTGAWNTALRMAVSAPPEGGKANKHVCALLAATLGVRRADVTITHGHTQPLKRVRIEGLSAAHARRALAAALGSRNHQPDT
jgi:uncharacterized protein (TIGR00251 family)